jgi:hypothetical protein
VKDLQICKLGPFYLANLKLSEEQTSVPGPMLQEPSRLAWDYLIYQLPPSRIFREAENGDRSNQVVQPEPLSTPSSFFSRTPFSNPHPYHRSVWNLCVKYEVLASP